MQSKSIQVINPEGCIFIGSTGYSVSKALKEMTEENLGPAIYYPAFQNYVLVSASRETPTHIDDPHERIFLMSPDNVKDSRDPQDVLFHPGLARLSVPISDTKAFNIKADGAGMEARYGSALMRFNTAMILSDFHEIYSKLASDEAKLQTELNLSKMRGPIEISDEISIRLVGSASGGTCSGALLFLAYLLKKEYPEIKISAEISLIDSTVGSDPTNLRMKANATALLETLEFYATQKATFRAVYGANSSEFFTLISDEFPFDSINLISASNPKEALPDQESDIVKQIALNIYSTRFFDIQNKGVDLNAINPFISQAPFNSLRVALQEVPAYHTKMLALRGLMEPADEEKETRIVLEKAKGFAKESTDDKKKAKQGITETISAAAADMLEPNPFLQLLLEKTQAELEAAGQQPQTESPKKSGITSLFARWARFGKENLEPSEIAPVKHSLEMIEDVTVEILSQKPWEKQGTLSGFFSHVSKQLPIPPSMPLTEPIAEELSLKLREAGWLSEIKANIQTGGLSYEEIVERFVRNKEVSRLFNDLCKQRIDLQLRVNRDSEEEPLISLNLQIKPLIRLLENRANLGLDDLFFTVSSNVPDVSRINAKRIIEVPDNAVLISRAAIGLRLADIALSQTGGDALRKLTKNNGKPYAVPELPQALSDERWYERFNLLHDWLYQIEDEIQHPVQQRRRLAKNDTSTLDLLPRGRHRNGTVLFPVIAFSPDEKKSYDLSLPEDFFALVSSAVDHKKLFYLLDPDTSPIEETKEILEIRAYFEKNMPANGSSR